VEGLLDLVNEMNNQHFHFKTLTDKHRHEDTGWPVLFHVMASLAQMEQELIVERTRAVAGSRDRTLRVWVAERRGDYHLHRRGSGSVATLEVPRDRLLDAPSRLFGLRSVQMASI